MSLVVLPRRGVGALIRLYQLFVGPLLGQRCRFYPSCSAYALTSVERLGVIRSIPLVLWRLLRCQPWGRGGVDMPPESTRGCSTEHRIAL